MTAAKRSLARRRRTRLDALSDEDQNDPRTAPRRLTRDDIWGLDHRVIGSWFDDDHIIVDDGTTWIRAVRGDPAEPVLLPVPNVRQVEMVLAVLRRGTTPNDPIHQAADLALAAFLVAQTAPRQTRLDVRALLDLLERARTVLEGNVGTDPEKRRFLYELVAFRSRILMPDESARQFYARDIHRTFFARFPSHPSFSESEIAVAMLSWNNPRGVRSRHARKEVAVARLFRAAGLEVDPRSFQKEKSRWKGPIAEWIRKVERSAKMRAKPD